MGTVRDPLSASARSRVSAGAGEGSVAADFFKKLKIESPPPVILMPLKHLVGFCLDLSYTERGKIVIDTLGIPESTRLRGVYLHEITRRFLSKKDDSSGDHGPVFFTLYLHPATRRISMAYDGKHL